MRSACLSTSRKADLVFHVFRRPLGSDHELCLHRIPAEFGAALVLHDLDGDSLFGWLMAKAPPRQGAPDIGYARLLFAESLPREVARLVYLDCEMLIRAPIERLAEMDLFGRALAAAPDPTAQDPMSGHMLIDRRGLEEGGRPFDAGLMVIDLERWRDLRLLDRFEALLDDGGLEQFHAAGAFLNRVLRDDWFELSQLWDLVDPRPLHEALNPFAVHYSGRDKPWRIASRAGFRRAYRHTMTDDVFYRFLAERSPRWLQPLVLWLKRANS
jgi:lipopolysaccharide biosynthesis glycosyltransferase